MQLQSPPPSIAGKPQAQSSPLQSVQEGKRDVSLQLLQGPVISVCVGSGLNIASYNLPLALLCHHSRFFQQKALRHEDVSAGLDSNKKRKLSVEDESTAVQVKVENGDRPSPDAPPSDKIPHAERQPVLKLPEVDLFIFGLFLRVAYTGYYPAAVDAQNGTTHSLPGVTTSKRPVVSAPARASMLPPARARSQETCPNGNSPPSSIPASITSSKTHQESNHYNLIPPSVRAYLLSVQIGAPFLLNQAISHIYYGIGKHFTLNPTLVHYVWSNTHPHPYCSSSPLRKLFLDVLVAHWASTSKPHIIAKQPMLNKSWNEVLDLHRDLRHEFTMGLQGLRRILPVQAYLVETSVLVTPAKEQAKAQEPRVDEIIRKVNSSARVAAASADIRAEQDASNDNQRS